MNDIAHLEPRAQNPARFTIPEFMEMVDCGVFSGSRVELVDGVIVRMRPSMSRHMRYSRAVCFSLHAIFGEGIDGYVAQFELSVQLGPDTLRDIDVGIVKALNDEMEFPDPATILLAVEIAVTSLAEDMGPKLRDYARAGIPHYWVVDVEGRRVHVMKTPLDGDYADRKPYAFGEAIAVPGSEATITIGGSSARVPSA